MRLGAGTKPPSQTMSLEKGVLLGRFFTFLIDNCYFSLREGRVLYSVPKIGTPKGGKLFWRGVLYLGRLHYLEGGLIERFLGVHRASGSGAAASTPMDLGGLRPVRMPLLKEKTFALAFLRTYRGAVQRGDNRCNG